METDLPGNEGNWIQAGKTLALGSTAHPGAGGVECAGRFACGSLAPSGSSTCGSSLTGAVRAATRTRSGSADASTSETDNAHKLVGRLQEEADLFKVNEKKSENRTRPHPIVVEPSMLYCRADGCSCEHLNPKSRWCKDKYRDLPPQKDAWKAPEWCPRAFDALFPKKEPGDEVLED